MNVAEAGRKRTGELIDALAHEAGLVDGAHHVHGEAFAKSGAIRHRERNDDGQPSDVAEHAAFDGLLELVTWGADRFGPHLARASRAASAVEGGAEVVSILWLGVEAVGALIDAEEKGVAIRAAFDNDAVHCALAGNLAFDPAFAALEQHARPGVTAGTTKLTLALQAPGHPIKPVLQARADEGFLAAERAATATADVPPKERPLAIARWYRDNGYGGRMRDDIAFAKGAEYHAFVTHASAAGLYDLRADDELRKVQARAPLERPWMVQP